LAQHPLAGGWFTEEERASRQGLRGLRLSLTRPELFQVQLRALLRAARHGNLRIMFPFVSSVEQVRHARAMIAEARAELARRGENVPRRASSARASAIIERKNPPPNSRHVARSYPVFHMKKKHTTPKPQKTLYRP